MMEWNSILDLPSAALAGDRPIPKTQLVTQGDLTKHEEKKLRDMESLTFFASLSKTSTHMLPVKDDTHDIEAIVILRCALRSSSSPMELGDILHKVFPNPTLLLFEAPDDSMGLSVAIKRKSLAENGAVVVENTQGTGLFDASSKAYGPLLQRLRFGELPQGDLLEYASAMADRCMLARTIPVLGFYPTCSEDKVGTMVDYVQRLQSLQSEISRSEDARRSKDVTLAESTKLRIEITNDKKQRDLLAEEIRNLCNE